MKDQHTLIKGYRDLSAHDIAIINDIKYAGVELGELCERLETYLTEKVDEVYSVNDDAEIERFEKARPFHWLEQGRHELQTALMKITRAIAQPASF